MTDTPWWIAQRYLVVDVEGNGVHPPDLVELGIVPITEGAIGTPVSWLVRPDTAITPMARRIHGITNDQVAGMPTFDVIHTEVLEHLTDVVIVGHNVHIDLDVLRRKLPDWRPSAALDTLRLARKLLSDLPSHKLGVLVDHLDLAAGLPADLQPHRATYDALVTARLFTRLASRQDGTARTADDLHSLGGLSVTVPGPDPAPRLFDA